MIADEDAADYFFSIPPQQLLLDELSFMGLDDIDLMLSSEGSSGSPSSFQGTTVSLSLNLKVFCA